MTWHQEAPTRHKWWKMAVSRGSTLLAMRATIRLGTKCPLQWRHPATANSWQRGLIRGAARRKLELWHVRPRDEKRTVRCTEIDPNRPSLPVVSSHSQLRSYQWLRPADAGFHTSMTTTAAPITQSQRVSPVHDKAPHRCLFVSSGRLARGWDAVVGSCLGAGLVRSGSFTQSGVELLGQTIHIIS